MDNIPERSRLRSPSKKNIERERESRKGKQNEEKSLAAQRSEQKIRPACGTLDLLTLKVYEVKSAWNLQN